MKPTNARASIPSPTQSTSLTCLSPETSLRAANMRNRLQITYATELIAAGVDIRTVAGRLGHGGGGSTTLRVYAAWLSEADQRASSALLQRVPQRPQREVTHEERAKVVPSAPYEVIAAQIRQEILRGTRKAGDAAPTVLDLKTEHGVGAGTAHRSLVLLRQWGLVSETSRGRRSVILEPPASEMTAAEAPPAEASTADAEPADGPTLLDLRLLHLGDEVRRFTAEADPTSPQQLRQLLTAAARRHGGYGVDIADYELAVRHARSDELITTFATL